MPFVRSELGQECHLHFRNFRSTFVPAKTSFMYGAPKPSKIAVFFVGNTVNFDIAKSVKSTWRRSTLSEEALREEVLSYDTLKPDGLFTDPYLIRSTREIVRKLFQLRQKGRPYHLLDLENEQSISSSLPWSHSPGLPYTQQDLHSKREAWAKHKDQLRRRIHNAKVGDALINFPPAMVSARNHLVPKNGPDKVRGVYAYPMDVWAVETMLFHDLIQRYKEESTVYAMQATPLIGGLNVLATPHAKFGSDFSSFDKTIHPWLIEEAFRVIGDNVDFSAYSTWGVPDAQAMRRLFEAVKDYFINTPLMLPNGEVFVKRGGVPSGSLLTNLVDSIVNAFVSIYACLAMRVSCLWDKCRFFGDDSILVFPTLKNESNDHFWNPETWADVVYEAFGIIANANKSTYSTDSSVEFLGFKVTNRTSRPHRDIGPLLAALIHPETSDRSVEDFYQRLIGISYVGAFNDKFLNMCLEIERLLFSTDQIDWTHFRFKKTIGRLMRITGVPYLTEPRCCTAQDYAALIGRLGHIIF